QGLVREFAGRRLNFHEPEKSLLLQKAIAELPHQGGRRTAPTNLEYQILLNWIKQKAPIDDAAAAGIKKLAVEPAQHVAKAGTSYPLKVRATFSDGSSEDVTQLCTFETLDDQVALVDRTGLVQALAVGDGALVVRYGAEPIMASVVVPRESSEPFPDVKPNNFVDKHVLDKLRRLGMPPAELTDDATFLRRASLDIAGTLPTPEEVRRFLADSSADKRAKKIDELLKHPGHAALWATRFCDLLKATDYNANFAFVEAAENRRFYEWIRARLVEETPYDQLVERILLATSREGRTQEQWLEEVIELARENAADSPALPAYAKRKTLDLYWQRENATGVKGTLQVAHAFLGLRLECAQCHRHPHDVWKQDDLLSFSNFFTNVKGARYPNAKELPQGYADMIKKGPDQAKKLQADAKKLEDQLKKEKDEQKKARLTQELTELRMKASAMANGPKRFGTEIRSDMERINYASVSSPLGNQKSDTFRLLGETQPIDVKKDKDSDPRTHVMEWLRRPDNPYFARAIANRVWAHYFGRGIVDPPDHLSPLNPASHPELLQELADGFIKNKYDLKWLHRTIANSRTYQQGCQPHPAAKLDRKNYAYFYLRRLPAEVLVDAINHATGGNEEYPEKLYLPRDARAIEVAGAIKNGRDEASLAFAFQIFGRPLRDAKVQCDCERDDGTTIVQTLYLANHPRVRDKITSAEGRLAQVLAKINDDSKRVEELYLWTLNRPPSAEEIKTCLDYVKGSPEPRKGFEDILWSLINTREFVLNH
ncbi:MAG: DUF1549 domain-containing protein, partial [Gemmataceae bacterium]